MRIFLDANVLFSACLSPGSRSRAFFDLTHRKRCLLIWSSYVLEETSRNLAGKAPHALASLDELVGLGQLTSEPGAALLRWAEAQGLPPKDVPILGAAVAAHATILVTGDRRHFGHLFGQSLRGVRVLPLVDGLAAALDVPVCGS
jgi:uncharacterized protein